MSKLTATLAGIRARRAALAAAYQHLQLVTSEQWRVDTAGVQWWRKPWFTLEETAEYLAANRAVAQAEATLPWLLRLGVRARAMSTHNISA